LNQTKSATANRILFFDNLRYLMVLLVLIFHSSASYSEMVAFWPLHEMNTSHLLDIIVILLDVFMMIILFFIAGYFALPSLQKKGGWRFLVANSGIWESRG
jgi:glucan biosynthesis protein C